MKTLVSLSVSAIAILVLPFNPVLAGDYAYSDYYYCDDRYDCDDGHAYTYYPDYDYSYEYYVDDHDYRPPRHSRRWVRERFEHPLGRK
jgi:hypothetical protein